jgi:hypothetical protein
MPWSPSTSGAWRGVGDADLPDELSACLSAFISDLSVVISDHYGISDDAGTPEV